MSEKWESESLRWIHSVRKRSYEKTKGKSLKELALGPTQAAKALSKKLGLKRVPLPTDTTPAAHARTGRKGRRA